MQVAGQTWSRVAWVSDECADVGSKSRRQYVQVALVPSDVIGGMQGCVSDIQSMDG